VYIVSFQLRFILSALIMFIFQQMCSSSTSQI